MSFKAIITGGAVLACAALAAPAAAQQRGTVEFGAFGSAGRYDRTLTLDRGIGAGGHVGVFLDPRWAIEFEKSEMKASRTLGLAKVNVGLTSARLVATPIQSGAFSLHIGAGGGAGTETNFLHSYGVNGLVGMKIALSNYSAIRVDAVSDWLANYDWKSHQRIQAGLSFFRGPVGRVRTVEVPMAAAPCNCVDYPDSVSAAEQARLRSLERDYRALRDSLSRIPAPAPISSETARLTMEERIHFAFDKSDLTDSARTILDAKVAVFRANPTMTVLITGHTGNMGTDNYNWALGTRRADAAKAYLVAQGISADRIEIETRGESQPAVTSPTAVGIPANAPNRRGIFRLVVVPDVIKKP